MDHCYHKGPSSEDEIKRKHNEITPSTLLALNRRLELSMHLLNKTVEYGMESGGSRLVELSTGDKRLSKLILPVGITSGIQKRDIHPENSVAETEICC
ncbi:hypothetical protein NPIL_291911 [Nephila pilipes]|uniref:Uncharacterized protein n=1 Tax=Nephila pilipes TaxID=299642 RepID=A0A8X6NNC3_NEPPI|nr:hypothetical protein NPIL_291911 [Nephila pilipes]